MQLLYYIKLIKDQIRSRCVVFLIDKYGLRLVFTHLLFRYRQNRFKIIDLLFYFTYYIYILSILCDNCNDFHSQKSIAKFDKTTFMKYNFNNQRTSN